MPPRVQGPLEFTNNLYSLDGEAKFNWKGTMVSFTEWRTVTQLDGNSLLADPQLTSLQPSAPRDFALSASSQAVGHGIDLGNDKKMALAPSLQWPAEVKLLPQEPGRWDIGAFRHPQ